jgi:hypothetical protein
MGDAEMRINFQWSIFFLICSRITPVVGADCSDVLRVAYDRSVTALDTKTVNAAKQLACSNKSVFTNDNGNLKYDDLSISFSTPHNEIDAWCNGSSSFDFIDQKFRQNIRAVNPLVVREWGACMNSNSLGVKVGMTAALDPNTDTPRTLVIALQYNAPTPGEKAILRYSELTNLTCQNSPQPLDAIDVRQNYTCGRTNQFDPSTISFTFSNVPSPDPIVVAGLPRPFTPKFQLSGAYKRADNSVGVTVVQSGADVAWSAESTEWSMSMQGGYYTDTQAVGIQTRSHKIGTPCTNQMTVIITALGDHHWSHTGSYRSGPTCGGVGPGFVEGPWEYQFQ